MDNKRIIALDLGTNSCGIAISDKSNVIPVGLFNIKHNNDFSLIVNNLEKKIYKVYNISHIIIGIPLNKNFKINQMSIYIERFKIFLTIFNKKNNYNYEIILVNEFNSTQEFINDLKFMNIKYHKKKHKKDIHAAMNILSTYLNKINKN